MLIAETVSQTTDVQPYSHSESNSSGLTVTNSIGLASIFFILLASMYTFTKMNQTSESNRSRIKSLLLEVERHKHDAINRYERDVDQLIERVRQIAQSSQKSAENKFLNELALVNFAGFEGESKIAKFNEFTLKPIIESEYSDFQESLRSLGEEFYSVEDRLDKDFVEIIRNLRNNCRKLRIVSPDLSFFKLPSQSVNKFLPSAGSKERDQFLLIGLISSATALGFFPSDAIADTTGHGLAHGTGHGAGHGLAHGTGHGVGHGLAHGAGHGIGHGIGHGVGHGLAGVLGFAVPVVSIGLAAFSLYSFGKFLFDDTDIKKDIRTHTINQIKNSYRIIIEGDKSDLGLYGQLNHIKDEFLKGKKELLDASLKPTLESVNKRFLYN